MNVLRRAMSSIPVLCAATAAITLMTLTALAQSPEEDQFDFANGLFSRGFNQEAVEEYEAYLHKYPKAEHRATALYRLGESRSAVGDYGGALETLETLLAEPIDATTRQQAELRRGVTLYHLKRFADATPILSTLAELTDSVEQKEEALYYLGKLHHEAGNSDRAVEAFSALCNSSSESALVPYARYQLAFVHLSRDEVEKAAIEFSQIAQSDKVDDAMRMECRFRAAEAYDKIGWTDTAIKAYQLLRSEFPDSDYARRATYGQAWALYHAGRYAEATVSAQQFLNDFPQSPHASGLHYLMANSKQYQGQYSDAIKIYHRILQEHRESEFAPRAHYKMAWAYYLNDQRDRAKEEVLVFLNRDTHDSLEGDAAFLLGSILAHEGNYADATEEFQLVVSKYPKSEFAGEALYKSAECLSLTGKTAEAAAVFDQFSKKYPGSLLAPEAALLASDAEFRLGHFAGAIAKYEAILENDPETDLEEQVRYRLGLALHNAERFTKSHKVFLDLVEKFPASDYRAEALLHIGDTMLREGKAPLKALGYFESALQADPKGPHAGPALKGLALARFETKDFDGAAQVFVRVMTEYPTILLNEGTYEWAGQHLFDREEWSQSIIAFSALLERHATYSQRHRVRFKMGEAYEALDNANEAINMYDEVIQDVPTSPTAIQAKYRLAKLHEQNGRVGRAIVLYEDAANANSGDTAAKARFRLGELYEARQDFDLAAKNFMRVAILFLHPELSPESLLRAAQCFEKDGDGMQARKTYQEVVKDYPGSTQAQKAQARLSELQKGQPR